MQVNLKEIYFKLISFFKVTFVDIILVSIPSVGADTQAVGKIQLVDSIGKGVTYSYLSTADKNALIGFFDSANGISRIFITAVMNRI